MFNAQKTIHQMKRVGGIQGDPVWMAAGRWLCMVCGSKGCAPKVQIRNFDEKVIIFPSPIKLGIFFVSFENILRIEFLGFCNEICYKWKSKPSSLENKV